MNLNNQYINLNKNVDKMLSDIKEEVTVPKMPGILTKDFLKHLNKITAEFKKHTPLTFIEDYKQRFGLIGGDENTEGYMSALRSDKPPTELGLENER